MSVTTKPKKMSNEKGQACSSSDESLKVNATEAAGNHTEEVGTSNKGDQTEIFVPSLRNDECANNVMSYMILINFNQDVNRQHR